jgi:uncharacterized membrane protein (UPF0127 family)
VAPRLGGAARARLAAAAVVAVVCAAGIALLVAHWISTKASVARLGGALRLRESAAVAPFTGYRDVRLVVDGRCRRVAVADSLARRESGLRGRDRLGPYAGMLFVYGGDTRVEFTMSDVAVPLDIAFYASDGTRVDGARMRACPHRDQAHCPVYGSRVAYRYALETHPGTPAPLVLTGCG